MADKKPFKQKFTDMDEILDIIMDDSDQDYDLGDSDYEDNDDLDVGLEYVYEGIINTVSVDAQSQTASDDNEQPVQRQEI